MTLQRLLIELAQRLINALDYGDGDLLADLRERAAVLRDAALAVLPLEPAFPAALEPWQVRDRAALITLRETNQRLAGEVAAAEARANAAWAALAAEREAWQAERERLIASASEAHGREAAAYRESAVEVARKVAEAVGPFDAERRSAAATIAAMGREIRILKRQAGAGVAALRVYAKDDERRGVGYSVADAALKQIEEAIPAEEGHDDPARRPVAEGHAGAEPDRRAGKERRKGKKR